MDYWSLNYEAVSCFSLKRRNSRYMSEHKGSIPLPLHHTEQRPNVHRLYEAAVATRQAITKTRA